MVLPEEKLKNPSGLRQAGNSHGPRKAGHYQGNDVCSMTCLWSGSENGQVGTSDHLDLNLSACLLWEELG